MARPMEKVSINSYSEKSRLSKLLQLPYTHPDTSSKQITVKNNTK